jgi:WD40 repeat protein
MTESSADCMLVNQFQDKELVFTGLEVKSETSKTENSSKKDLLPLRFQGNPDLLNKSNPLLEDKKQSYVLQEEFFLKRKPYHTWSSCTEELQVLTNGLIIYGEKGSHSVITNIFKVWKIKSGEKVLLFEGNVRILSPYGLPNDEIIGIIQNSFDKDRIGIFNPKTGETRLSSDTVPCCLGAKFYLLNATQVMVGYFNVFEIWNLQTLKLEHSLRKETTRWNIFPNGKIVIITDDYKVEVWDPFLGVLEQSFGKELYATEIYIISNDLFVTSGLYKVHIWDRRTGTNICLEGKHHFDYICVIDSQRIACYQDGSKKLKIFDITTGTVVLTLEVPDLGRNSMKLLSKSQIAMAAGKTLSILDFETGTLSLAYVSEFPIDNFGFFQETSLYLSSGERKRYEPAKVEIIKPIST